jgi:hypothetical protein
VDPETLESQETLDEAFDTIVVLAQPISPDPNDDWLAGGRWTP